MLPLKPDWKQLLTCWRGSKREGNLPRAQREDQILLNDLHAELLEAVDGALRQ